MRFDPRRRLDTSQVSDQRGRRRVGGTGMAIGGGGGIVGIPIVLVAVLLLGGGEGGAGGLEVRLDSLLNQTAGGSTESVPSTLAEDCRTGADANEREDCRIVGVVNSVQQFWQSVQQMASATASPRRCSSAARRASGCGVATSAVGPFYCPLDQKVYLDLGFFDELRDALRRAGRAVRAGVCRGPRVRPPRAGHDRRAGASSGRDHGPESGAVRVELQADCLAGVWAHERGRHRLHRGADARTTSPTASTPPRRSATTASRSRPRAASTRSRGRTARPSSASAGSSGYQQGVPDACDTFGGDICRAHRGAAGPAADAREARAALRGSVQYVGELGRPGGGRRDPRHARPRHRSAARALRSTAGPSTRSQAG